MSIHFNLVEEPWILCLMPDGSRVDLGLRETLCRSHEIGEIVDPSPLVVAALHRLLLAVLHRNFGPSGAEDWAKLKEAGRLDPSPIESYLRKWEDRFELFDEKHPFYQCAEIPSEECQTSSAKLLQELASGNNATLFDHTIEAELPALYPAQAARAVIGHQAFAVGGLITPDASGERSAKGAPLAKGAVVLVCGENLFETLLLNFHPYNEEDELPFRFDPGKDKPAWERDEPTRPQERMPDGHLDLLTWQSRRIRLKPEVENRNPVVRWVSFMKGFYFPEGYWLRKREVMVAFSPRAKAAPRADPWPPVTLQPDRALWRDSLALFQATTAGERPMTVSWLNDLAIEGILPRGRVIPISVLGMATDQAKITLWRHERLPLPLEYLDNPDLVEILSTTLKLAEDVGSSLWRSGREFSARLVAGRSVKSLNRFQRQECDGLFEHFAPTRPYWSALEVPFKRFVVNLAREPAEREEATRRWAKEVQGQARDAFSSMIEAAGTDAQALRVAAEVSPDFRRTLARLVKSHLEEEIAHV